MATIAPFSILFLGIGLTAFVYSAMALAMHTELRKEESGDDPSINLFVAFIVSLILGIFLTGGMMYLMIRR